MTAAPPSPPTPDRVAEIAARLEASNLDPEWATRRELRDAADLEWLLARLASAEAALAAKNAEVERLTAEERTRCAAIVMAARTGEIDGDFRSIHSRIKSGRPYPDFEWGDQPLPAPPRAGGEP